MDTHTHTHTHFSRICKLKQSYVFFCLGPCDPGQRACPSHQPVWWKANGGAPWRHLQRRRPIRGSRHPSVPGASQSGRLQPGSGGESLQCFSLLPTEATATPPLSGEMCPSSAPTPYHFVWSSSLISSLVEMVSTHHYLQTTQGPKRQE